MEKDSGKGRDGKAVLKNEREWTLFAIFGKLKVGLSGRRLP